MDTSALLALVEQAAKKTPTKKKEGEVQMIIKNNEKQKQILSTFTVQPIQNQQRLVQARGAAKSSEGKCKCYSSGGR